MATSKNTHSKASTGHREAASGFFAATVLFLEVAIILSAWNQNVPPGDPLAVPSGDGFVDIADLGTVLDHWNAVPEPARAALLAVGGLVLLRRRSV